MNEGYYVIFKEFIEKINWNNYGYKSGNFKCFDCMVYCGYELIVVMVVM